MTIAVDFDGTCVKHAYPAVGESIGAERVLRKLVENGHDIILYTMRSHKPNEFWATIGGKRVRDFTFPEDTLQLAIDWFRDNGIELYGVNENPSQKEWTDSPKPYAHIYIDDSAFGCPLSWENDARGHVDWVKVEEFFRKIGAIEDKEE